MKLKMPTLKTVMVVVFYLGAGHVMFAQTDSGTAALNDEELAKKLANPIASLISVPFQNNIDIGIGDLQATRYTLNFQPVVPLKISDGLNLITRYIVPVISQYNVTGLGDNQFGLSDAVVSAFFSPTGSGITWGAGPVFLVPIATDDYLATKKFGIGPTAVALVQSKGWTFGGLINQIWSVSGSDTRPDVSQLFFQPFITYNWKSGAGLAVNMEMTQNWEANTNVAWLNLTASAVTSFNKQKVQFVVGPRINIASPDELKADFGLRAMIVLLFPN
jgi:hypothetical protein